ncbi:hypothetical protein [Thermogemmatispora onikobensis]|uniref:hypothetical protein n=1 Tax=Thermogemmatispora onikobensis TaxID=732234 RepID=UPI00114CE204|nr:hypothetical protein [Thermogemmatispora onikobensis]
MIDLELSHPFPARIAPEVTPRELRRFPTGSAVLDPMMGSGTVARAVLDQRLQASGRDLDPPGRSMGYSAMEPRRKPATGRVGTLPPVCRLPCWSLCTPAQWHIF